MTASSIKPENNRLYRIEGATRIAFGVAIYRDPNLWVGLGFNHEDQSQLIWDIGATAVEELPTPWDPDKVTAEDIIVYLSNYEPDRKTG